MGLRIRRSRNATVTLPLPLQNCLRVPRKFFTKRKKLSRLNGVRWSNFGSVLIWIWLRVAACRVWAKGWGWVYKPHSPSYQTLGNRGGEIKSIIWTRRTCATTWPLLSLLFCMVISPHFDICLGTSNVHVKSLTFKITVPDSTSALVSISGNRRIKESTPLNCLTNVLVRVDSSCKKSSEFSWNSIRHSSSLVVPILHIEQFSDMSPNKAFDDCELKNDMPALHPNGVSSGLTKRGVEFDFILTIILTLADADAMGFFEGSFCHSAIAVHPANITSIKTPAITSHSPQNLTCFDRLNCAIFLKVFRSASCSISNPTSTSKPPEPAMTTAKKSDTVVILIYAIRPTTKMLVSAASKVI
jgi:hypothetical protein